MSNKEYLYDMRVVGLNIKEGKLKEKDHKNFIKNLKDVKDKSETLVIEEEVTEDEELEIIDEEDGTETE